MLAWTRTNLALPVALLALVVALGGTAVAATAAKNSVTSKSIKNNAVKSADVKNNGLTGKDIREETLKGIKATSVAGVKIKPFELNVPTDNDAFVILQESGNVASVRCRETGSVAVSGRRSTSSPPWVLEWVPNNSAPDLFHFVANGATITTANSVSVHATFTMLKHDGSTVVLSLVGVYEEDLGGSTDDCYFRGTVTRTP